jgi:SAM-dependent methyltransferase
MMLARQVRNGMKRVLETVLPGFILGPMLTRRMMRKYQAYAGRSPEDIFTDIHDKKLWRGRQSLSGQGSDLQQTQTIRRVLPEVIKQYDIKSILDVPCGDFHWMREVELANCQYVGGDIVAAMIEKCQAAFGDARRRFAHVDITRDELPKCDLILCRDCFIHLSLELIQAAVQNFRRSGARYLFVTNAPTKKVNIDIPPGGYRPVNLRLAPFHFPPPLYSMHDDAPSQLLKDNPDFQRYMELWDLSAIRPTRFHS